MAHRRNESPVMLTHYQSIDMFMSEVRSIRESRAYEPIHKLSSVEPQQLSQGDSTRGTDHESSEEEGDMRERVNFGAVFARYI